MQAYLNDPKLKEKFVKEIEKHRKADQILQGTYGKENGTWKGCAVACSLRSLDIIEGKDTKVDYSDHKRYESELGIPEWLARLEDTIFEGLPKEEAMKWPAQFSRAIPVGVNLEPVKWQFCAYLMKENIDRVLSLNISDELKEQVVKALQGVLSLHETAIRTGKWDGSARSARSARSAAWSAAESAAWSARSARSARSAAWSAESAAWSAESAARSAARSAAWSAAESAAWSAWSARSARSARSAARSAAWSAAESAAYIKHSKKLLELLEGAK